MSGLDFWAALTLHSAPLLPSAQSLVWARHVVWSLLLCALGLRLLPRGPRACMLRRWLVGALALWAWVPGVWGISYWLGLAFQTPSLSAAFLALSALLRVRSTSAAASSAGARPLWNWTMGWASLAGVLTVTLVLDTFAVLDFSLYPWGFTPVALAMAWVVCLLPWLVSGKAAWGQVGVWPLCAAVLVFTLTRWPTGNVWDAVLDPWLGLVAGVYALRWWGRRVG